MQRVQRCELPLRKSDRKREERSHRWSCEKEADVQMKMQMRSDEHSTLPLTEPSAMPRRECPMKMARLVRLMLMADGVLFARQPTSFTSQRGSLGYRCTSKSVYGIADKGTFRDRVDGPVQWQNEREREDEISDS